jgi:hypothetical protein
MIRVNALINNFFIRSVIVILRIDIFMERTEFKIVILYLEEEYLEISRRISEFSYYFE